MGVTGWRSRRSGVVSDRRPSWSAPSDPVVAPTTDGSYSIEVMTPAYRRGLIISFAILSALAGAATVVLAIAIVPRWTSDPQSRLAIAAVLGSFLVLCAASLFGVRRWVRYRAWLVGTVLSVTGPWGIKSCDLAGIIHARIVGQRAAGYTGWSLRMSGEGTLHAIPLMRGFIIFRGTDLETLASALATNPAPDVVGTAEALHLMAQCPRT